MASSSSSTAGRKYDLIIFGASGFTGQYTVEEMARVAQKESGSIRWAIAGRSESKLKDTLKACAEQTKIDQLKSVPIVLADVGNPASLADMAKLTRVLISCVGPYRFFGEPVVKACVDSGTHYLDVSGEPQFLETMQLKYNESARAKGIYIVGSCGWDSIPCEMGILFTELSAPGPLNSVEGFYRIVPGPDGTVGHFGTWQSAVEGFAHRGELTGIRRKLFPERLPKPRHRLSPRSLISWSRETESWCVPFPGSDRSVVMRSERALKDLREKDKDHRRGRPGNRSDKDSENNARRPVLQYFPYMQVGSLIYAVAMLLLGSLFGLLASFRATRRLLESHPRLFSLGAFSHSGPTRRQVETTSFTMTFVGLGWNRWDVDQPTPQPPAADDDGSSAATAPEAAPTCRTVTRLTGPEPGYVCTPICLLQAAMCLLTEPDAMPKKGGVLTPGVAFRGTGLINRLKSCGLDFAKIVVDDVSQ